MTDEPFPLTDVTVVGTRAVAGAPRGGGGGSGGEVGGTDYDQVGEEPTLPPEAYWTEEEAAAENERQDECAAKKFGERVTARGPRGDEVEHFSVTWKQDGETVTTETREATGQHENLPVGSAVSPGDFNSLSNDYGGIPLSQITGFNHSHAADIYCGGEGIQLYEQQRTNQVPSDNDWLFADEVTRRNVNHGLVLYLRDCEGQIRAFDYASNQDWRHGRLPTPAPIAPTDCPEDGT